MFDFLRNISKSAEEKQQEAISAYLDDALSPTARHHFEQQMGQNVGLQEAVRQQQQVRFLLQQLPMRQVPRHFTLEPAVYRQVTRPAVWRYYPALQAATALTAVLFFITVGLGIFTGRGSSAEQSVASSAYDAPVAMQMDTVAVVPEVAEMGEVVVETLMVMPEEAVISETERVSDTLTSQSQLEAVSGSVDVAPPTDEMESDDAEEGVAREELAATAVITEPVTPTVRIQQPIAETPADMVEYGLPEQPAPPAAPTDAPSRVWLTAVQMGLLGVLLLLTAVLLYWRRQQL